MLSHDSTLFLDLGFSNTSTPSIATSTLDMDPTFSNALISHNMQIYTSKDHIPQDKVIKIHEDLTHLQHNSCLENISTTVIPTIENICHLIESDEGLNVMKNIAEIYNKHTPSTFVTSQPANTMVSQGGPNTPPPSTMASIPIYTTPQVATVMQSVSNVITSLTIPASIPNSYVASHVLSYSTIPSINIPFTFPSTSFHLHGPSHHTNSPNHLLHSKIISTIDQN